LRRPPPLLPQEPDAFPRWKRQWIRTSTEPSGRLADGTTFTSSGTSTRPDGDGSKLILIHSLPGDTAWHVHAMLGAWHLHLDALPATLAGEPIPRFVEQDFFNMRDKYAELIGPVP
jgi:hypothetical protein